MNVWDGEEDIFPNTDDLCVCVCVCVCLFVCVGWVGCGGVGRMKRWSHLHLCSAAHHVMYIPKAHASCPSLPTPPHPCLL